MNPSARCRNPWRPLNQWQILRHKAVIAGTFSGEMAQLRVGAGEFLIR
jgi:hypothetical protein